MPASTNIEYTDMVLAYGEAQGNDCEVQRIYREKTPNRVFPNRRTFYNVLHLRDYGSY